MGTLKKLPIVLCMLLALAGAKILPRYITEPGPTTIATKGAVWPKPQSEERYGGSVLITITDFAFQVTGNACSVVDSAVERYQNILAAEASLGGGPRNASEAAGQLAALEVRLTGDCPQQPDFSMDETYELRINSPDLEGAALLTASSPWGILRGLETFSQVATRVEVTGSLILDNLAIVDAPRFSHRGLLLDTSRHYIPISYILETLDALAYNKMNVFHWHIVDDQSFPYVSAAFPLLSERGAYIPGEQIYTPENVAQVIEYARVRGIRVVPEFDTPGHTRSWGNGYIDLLTPCYTNGEADGTYGPMDPTKNFTYEFMQTLLEEVVNTFADQYVHLGGDEVGFECWQSNPNILQFMADNNLTGDFAGLESYYIQRIVDITINLQARPIVWQEVFDNGVTIGNETVVHIWTGTLATELNAVTAAGHFALVSTCWYLDHLESGGDWQKYYTCEPQDFTASDSSQYDLVLGGEAAMWAEVVDESNVESRVWPRASATAERLWSPRDTTDTNEAATRLEEHYCRLRRRGINAQPPNGPGYCP